MYFEDSEATELFGDASYWEKLSGGALHVTGTPLRSNDVCGHGASGGEHRTGGTADARAPQPRLLATTPAAGAHAVSNLKERGFAVLPRGAVPAGGTDVFERLGKGVAALRAAGWPPAFLLVYDEMWQVGIGRHLF